MKKKSFIKFIKKMGSLVSFGSTKCIAGWWVFTEVYMGCGIFILELVGLTNHVLNM